jgi:hypothetical protein
MAMDDDAAFPNRPVCMVGNASVPPPPLQSANFHL